MRFHNDLQPTTDLTYADVFLVPVRGGIESRMDVSLVPADGIGTTIPVILANMTAVSGRRMAETVARRGGLAVFPQDIPPAAVADMTAAVKSAEILLDTPITMRPSDTVVSALDLINKRSHAAVIVIDAERRPVGIFTEADAVGVDRFSALESVMSTDPITLPDRLDPEELFEALTSRRIHFAPVVDPEGRLRGAVTEKGALRSALYTPALDPNGKLMVAAALGVNGDVAARARELRDLGVDVLVIDTAHGHQEKMLESLTAVREAVPDVPLVAGNVVTAQGTLDLLDRGADVVKVGVGPGAMCTTRMMTGVGRPQFSAVAECAEAARSRGKHIWADGGVKHPRDVALAIAAGATSVMIGSWFAGTYESAADAVKDSDGRLYKENYGMASARAVTNRAKKESAFQRARKEMFEEGISTSRMYLDSSTPSAEDILDRIVAGLRSACTYAGAADLEDFHERAVVGVQSASGYAEGLPHSRSW